MNAAAFEHIKPDTAKQLPTYPANLKRQFHRNEDWYAETGPGGKSNLELIIERWNRWTAQWTPRRRPGRSMHSQGDAASI